MAMRRGAMLAALTLIVAGCAEEKTEAATPYEGRAPVVERGGAYYVEGTEITLPDYPLNGQINYANRVKAIAETPTPDGALAMVGDSITQGGDWTRLLPGMKAANFGIGWDRTSGLLLRISQVEDAKPARVVLLIGTNDVGAGVVNDEIAANMQEILRRLKEQVAPENIILQSVLPREAEFNNTIVDLNSRYEAIAAQEGVVFFDLYPHFLNGDQLDPSLTNDGLHLNDAGYQVWADMLRAQLTAD